MRQALPPISHEPWVLLVGRMAACKGLDVLVEAVWQLEKEAVGYPLAVVAGPGSLGAWSAASCRLAWRSATT